MPTLYDYADSGNGYKITLLAARLGRRLDRVEVDITRGETRTPEFLAINPNGKVPVLRLDDGAVLTESNAILCHLAEDTPFLPAAGLPRTRVMEWLFWEQYSHEPMIATLRYWARHLAHLTTEQQAQRESKRAGGRHALAVMERRLDAAPWLTDAGCTIADISLYAYTHVADQAGFDLDDYPAVRAWLERMAAAPGHVAMPDPAMAD